MRYVLLLLFALLSTPIFAQTTSVTDQPVVSPAESAKPERLLCPHCGKPLVVDPQTGEISHAIDETTGRTEQVAEDQSTAPSTAVHQTEQASVEEGLLSNPAMLPVLIGTGILLLSVIGLLLFFLVWKPLRNRKPLLEALAILQRDEVARFEQADQLLSRAIIRGLRAREVTEARFAQAYVRVRLEKYSEASAVLEDLKQSGPLGREAAYLCMRVHFQLKNFKQVIQIYNEYHSTIENLRDTKMIAGIANLKLGRQHWDRKEIDAAMHYFDQVRRLDVLSEEVPRNIDEYQVVLGIMSLFDQNIIEASKHFEGAIAAAKQQGKDSIQGQIGLLLCRWRKESFPDIDEELGALIDVYRGANKQKSSESKKEPELLLRNLLLWHSVSLLICWFHRTKESGLPKDERQKLQERLDLIEQVDPEMGDPSLIAGLIDYYFFGDTKRDEALKKLERSADHEVNVPEVINLIQREKKSKEMEKDRLLQFLSLLNDYLTEKGVPWKLRMDLSKRLERFPRFKKMLDEKVQIQKRKEEVTPSLKDVQTRGEFLRKRIDRLVTPMLSKAQPIERELLETLLKELQSTTQSIAADTGKLEETEHELMLRTGEFIFKEELTADSEDAHA